MITGFRVAAGGAQARYGVTPDLTTLGKVIGGGLPVGAFGGRADLMARIAPVGDVYQAGTLSGNPLAMTAGLAMLASLTDAFYTTLAATTDALASGIHALATDHGLPVTVNHVPGMCSLFFTAGPVRNFDDVAGADIARYRRFFHAMLTRGIYFAPSAYETAFVGGAHGESEVARTLAAMDDAFAELGS